MTNLSRQVKNSAIVSLFIPLIALFIVTSLQTGCGNKLELASQSLDRKIKVDGQHGDWEGVMTFMEKENVSVGLLNDNEFLYVCLVSGDRQIRSQIMRLGLTLWFDPHGGKNRTFGIRFPLGLQEFGVPLGGRGNERDMERFQVLFEESLSELEILGPDEDDRFRLGVMGARGIEVDAAISSGTLVYELKVPLKTSERYEFAMGAEAGGVVGVGLETGEFDREMMRERMGSSRPPGGMGGRRGGGGRGGSRGGGFGGGRPEMPEPLKVWANVQLAASN